MIDAPASPGTITDDTIVTYAGWYCSFCKKTKRFNVPEGTTARQAEDIAHARCRDHMKTCPVRIKNTYIPPKQSNQESI